MPGLVEHAGPCAAARGASGVVVTAPPLPLGLEKSGKHIKQKRITKLRLVDGSDLKFSFKYVYEVCRTRGTKHELYQDIIVSGRRISCEILEYITYWTR